MKNKWLKIFLLILVWGGFVICFKFLMKTYLADVYYEKSQKYLKLSKVGTAQRYADLAIESNPNEENYHRGRAKVNILALVSKSEYEKAVLKNNILADLEYSVNLNPNNLVVIRNSVPLYFFLSTNDLSKPAIEGNVDYTYLPHAKRFFEETKNSYFHDVGVIALVAKYEKRLGLEEEYNRSVKQIEILRPDLLDWYESFR